MPARRTRGDGGLTQRHDHKSCPAPVEVLDPAKGVLVKVRPEHRCKGRWQGTVRVAREDGSTKPKYVYGRTKEEARAKVREVVQAKETGTLVLDSVTVKEQFATQGIEAAPTSPEQFGAYLRTEVEKWGKVIRASGATPE